MKKLIIIALVVILNSGCATVFMGTSSERHCKVKPLAGEPTREIHVGALVFDIFFCPIGIAIDFLDGAIWKPCPVKKTSGGTFKL